MSQLLFWLAGLPSQSKPVGFANFPKGDGKPSQALPRLRGFNLLKAGRSFLRSAALSQKAALQMSSPSTTSPMKMGYRNARRRSDIPKFKNNTSSDYAQSTAEGILNRFICRKRLSAEEQQTALFPLHSCNLCNYDNFS